MPIGLIKKIFNKSQPVKSTNAPKKASPSSNSKKPNKPAAKPKAAPKKKTVAPWDPKQFHVEPAEGKTRFHDLNLDERIMRGIFDLGFQYASPIQSRILAFNLGRP